MINLLPDNEKREIRAARSNVILLRYNFLLFGVAGFLLASSLVVYALLLNTKNVAEATNATNTSRAAEFTSTRAQAEAYRKNLTTAAQILNNEVSYTTQTFEITKLLPAGIVLDNLNLSSKDFGTQTSISAHARDFVAVAALKQAFENSPLMTNVHFQTINSTAGVNVANQSYPLGVTINVTMNKVTK